MKNLVSERLTKEFGTPDRDKVKVKSWNISNNIGVVLQVDQPNKENAAFMWLPYPSDGQTIPEIALEYPGEAGRHSGTYPANGLKRGNPALKLTIRNTIELNDVINYIHAMLSNTNLPKVKSCSILEKKSYHTKSAENDENVISRVTIINPESMPPAEPIKPRRKAIPRLVQREVWQRDGGRCVECSTRERLCFDHIIPFSKGGGNSVRNLQLLCEGCNLSKSNQI